MPGPAAELSYRDRVADVPDPHVHSHGHSHAHGHGFLSGWEGWRGDRFLVSIVAAVAALAVLTVIGAVLLWPDGSGQQAIADTADEVGFVSERVTAEVTQVVDARCAFSSVDDPSICRTFTLELTSGDNVGSTISLPEFSLEFAQNVPPLDVGDAVVLGYEPTTDTYSYLDQDRRTSLVVLTVLFAIVVVALGRLRGLLALAGMAITVVVLVSFIAPAVLDGHDPVAVAVVGASFIAFVSLYLTHGISPTTSVALVSTLGALGITLILSQIFFSLAGFTGLSSEEALVLPLLSAEIDLADLLLGGAILGALGALDDVTVTQVATVTEIHRQRPDLATGALFSSGVRVGREHIASTVNTLLLAYAGAGIPLILLFAASDQSLSLVANSEVIAIEIVRTMCGSIGLVAAVPIATGLAALVSRGRSGFPSPHPSPDAPPPPDDPSWDDFAPDGEFWDRRRR